MSFLKTTFNLLTDKREIKEPIIHKDFNAKSELIQSLERLSTSDHPNIDQKKVDNHLKLFSIGQTGEKSVLFELQNSMLPIVVLHDVRIEIDDYEAQLDFVILTHKFILVLEVKKFFGNVKVTDKGEFQRVITKNNRVINKEGMYSPINQVERHVAILEKFLKAKGLIKKCPIRYAVTFANPKTILDISKKAPNNIKSSIIRHDQIKTFLSNELEMQSPIYWLDDKVMNLANILKESSKDRDFDESDYLLEVKDKAPIESKKTPLKPKVDLKEALTEFRLKRSKELDVKPYYIFTNKTLDAILEQKPKTIADLLKVEGIGPKKAEEFGEDILKLIN